MNRRGAIVIRPWLPADNQALIDIARRMSLPARVRIGIERSPDFTAFCRAAGQGFDIVVAEVDGRVAGFLESRRLAYRLRGDPVPLMYVALAGVDPSFRRLGLFRLLSAEAERRSRQTDVGFAIGLVNARNPRMSTHLATGRQDVVLGRQLVVTSLLLGPRYRTAPDLQAGPATPADIPEMALLAARCYSRHLLAPAVDETALSRLGVENIAVVRNRSRIVAMLGTWDQRALRRILVVGYGRAERVLRGVLNLTSGLTHLVRLPAPGEELRVVYAAYAAAEPDSEGEFAGLLRSVCGRCARLGYHALLLGLPEDDPLAGASRGMLQFRNVDLPVVIPRDDASRALLGVGPPSVRFESAFA
ncbi:hypothetical protein FJY68_08615 [candidate division WOR-3 bacterium]|uniref:N-acetyltransferase domain-containing protein n=1 Tax=candidate division WOR-3 bacterium TaxID=2052148 RepID=A0A937XEF4_UNCW3|nr:hypothetical protein [candidate division WOR-3 bacterium]